MRAIRTPVVTAFLAASVAAMGGDHVQSRQFTGEKVNKGTVSVRQQNGVFELTLSDDFVVPDTPAPHWQIVDAGGNTYLLQQLKIKGDKVNRTITAPTYVTSIAKVQIWCAWAEALLGEAGFDGVQYLSPLPLPDTGRSEAFQGVKANKGFVAFRHDGERLVLTLSDDFVVPDTPAPHWQIVDSHGETHLLQRLKIKGDKINRSIVVPDTVCDVAKVQIWCSFAETLLGEAALVAPIR
ncbi:MAG: hypothetical protein U1E73_05515 [Planctomycetota bacterium]